ncbi:MAG: hypothetical protein LBS21_15515 [Clostridiales bacterium]|jgi:hypothetical protein|nr:hypothetical protein [Clostridiales bacterium]
MKKKYFIKVFIKAAIVSPFIISYLFLFGFYIVNVFEGSLREGEFLHKIISTMRIDFISPVVQILQIVMPIYPFVFLAWRWYEYMKKKVFSVKLNTSNEPETSITASRVFAPIIAVFILYMLNWVTTTINISVSNYIGEGRLHIPNIYNTLIYLYPLIGIALGFKSDIVTFPILVIIVTAVIISATMLANYRTESKMIYDKKLKSQIIIVVSILAVVGILYIHNLIAASA